LLSWTGDDVHDERKRDFSDVGSERPFPLLFPQLRPRALFHHRESRQHGNFATSFSLVYSYIGNYIFHSFNLVIIIVVRPPRVTGHPRRDLEIVPTVLTHRPASDP
jgi:hypothetical protein